MPHKSEKWRKHGDSAEVKRIKGVKDEPGWVCLVRDCDAPLTEHGVAHVGPTDYPVMVHPGDEIEGSKDTLVVVSHGMRYGDN